MSGRECPAAQRTERRNINIGFGGDDGGERRFNGSFQQCHFPDSSAPAENPENPTEISNVSGETVQDHGP